MYTFLSMYNIHTAYQLRVFGDLTKTMDKLVINILA